MIKRNWGGTSCPPYGGSLPRPLFKNSCIGFSLDPPGGGPVYSAAMTSPLDEPVTGVKGVGPAVAERLARLGVATVRDLLWHFPREHQDRSHLTPIAELKVGDQVAFAGRIRDVKSAWWRGKGGVLTAIVEDETGQIAAVWFGMPYLQKQLKAGARLILWGKVTMGKRLSDGFQSGTVLFAPIGGNEHCPVDDKKISVSGR